MNEVEQQGDLVSMFGIRTEANSVVEERGEMGTAGMVAFELGKIQMQHFFNDGALPFKPGFLLAGKVRIVAKRPVVHAYDLAQMMGTWLGLMEGKFFRQSRLEIESLTGEMGAMRLGHGDFLLYQEAIDGAIEACRNNPLGRESDRAKRHLESLLEGARYRKWR